MRKYLFYVILGLLSFTVYGQEWEDIMKIVPSGRGPATGDFFGASSLSDKAIAVSGNYAIVGASNEDEDVNNENPVLNAGAAYIFKREGNAWVELQKIVASDREEMDNFGSSVAINDDFIVVGAFQESKPAGSGAAYIFKREGDTWVEQQKIMASDIQMNDRFGISVAIDGNYIVIGSYTNDYNANNDESSFISNAGAAYIFTKDGTLWVQQQKIVASVRGENDFFGRSVAISGDYIVVGSFNEDEDVNEGNTMLNSGSAYVFIRDGNTWTEQQKLVASDRGAGDLFGYSVDIDNDFIVIGAYQEDEDVNEGNTMLNSGSAYIFKHNGNAWNQQQKIVSTDRSEGDSYGYSVAISRDYIVIGANSKVEEWIRPNGTPGPAANAGVAYIYFNNGVSWIQQQKIIAIGGNLPSNYFGTDVAIEGIYTFVGGFQGFDVNGENYIQNSGSVYIYGTACTTPLIAVENPEPVCVGSTATLFADSEGNTVNWYDSVDSTEPVFTGSEFTTPELSQTTSYWVEAIGEWDCTSERVEVVVTVNPTPELIIENTTVETCEGTSAILTANSAATVHWYDSAEATEPVFTGASYETPELFETTSYWVEAQSGEGCISERIEIIINVLPAPELEIENPEVEICLGSDAYLYAFSEGNVIFWYAGEDDTEYLYHGNNFIVEGLTETTTFWVEAYNLNTGCVSERIPVTVTVTPAADISAEETEFEICAGNTATLTAASDSTVNWYDTADGTEPIFSGEEFTTPILNSTTHYWAEASGEGECVSGRIEFTVNVNASPDAPEAQPIQAYVEGMILADFEVEHTGTLHWYADEELTVELPDTTPVVIHTTYYVTQSLGDCESEATEIMADNFLNTGNPVKDEFAYYPNPVQDRLNFKGSKKVQSVQIFDMSGRLMMEQTSRNSGIEQLDVSSLPKGSYVVKAQTEKEVKTFKIVKN